MEILVASAAVFSLMCVFLLKRLLDVGLSKYWALLISGPIFLYLLFAINCANLTAVRWLLLAAGLPFLAFIVLIVVLIALPSKGTDAPKGG